MNPYPKKVDNTRIKFNKKCIVFFILILSFANIALTQQQPVLFQDWDSLNNAYSNNQLNDTAYLNGASQLGKKYQHEKNLKKLLNNYWKIAFSNDKIPPYYRADYFSLLALNSLWNNNTGAEIFYLKKEEEELKKLPGYVETLNPETVELALLSNWHKAALGLEKCKPVNGFLDSLPAKISSGKIPFTVIYNSQNILKFKQSFYQQLNDTANAALQINKSKRLLGETKKLPEKYSPERLAILNKDILFMEFLQYGYLKNDPATVNSILSINNEMGNARKNDYAWASYETLGFYNYFIDYYIGKKQLDSAARYSKLYKELSTTTQSNEITDESYWVQQSCLMRAEENYRNAYDHLQKAYNLKDSMTSDILFDISNNMYAQAESEYSKTMLGHALYQRKRTIIISILTLGLLAAAITMIYFLYRRSDLKNRKIIKLLENARSIENVELQDMLQMARVEEQQRLGVELHDDLAGTMAFLKIRMETEMLETKDEDTKRKFNEFSELLSDAYHKARNKSHQLYSSAKDYIDFSLKHRITNFLNKGLGGKSYQTTIHIDDEVVEYLPLKVKIELVYIIQEAVINIVKHAEAKKISLLIYKDIDGLILNVEDDGKGFNKLTVKKGIGLNSIESRVLNLKGKFAIESGQKGTKLTVEIP